MSWSNVVDYNQNGSFHAMAREFRASRHYGYGMNWSTTVYGACLLDMPQRWRRYRNKQIVEGGAAGRVSSSIDQAVL
jgi:hypothetical protein